MSATYFIDLDGTLVKHGTNNLLPGARELIDKIVASGGQIIITTRRGDKEFDGLPRYNAASVHQLIREHRIPVAGVIFDVDSPRILINDDGACAIIHTINEPWDEIEVDSVLSTAAVISK